LVPSIAAKIGSVPWVVTKRVCNWAGVALQPSVGEWQLAQLRPFVPSDLKNAFVGSAGTGLKVAQDPEASVNGPVAGLVAAVEARVTASAPANAVPMKKRLGVMVPSRADATVDSC
jgi:hypothetical protein